jgi:hypothetical protein
MRNGEQFNGIISRMDFNFTILAARAGVTGVAHANGKASGPEAISVSVAVSRRARAAIESGERAAGLEEKDLFSKEASLPILTDSAELSSSGTAWKEIGCPGTDDWFVPAATEKHNC